MKKYLIINHHAPIDGLHTEEILELVLSLSSLDSKVSMLLLQDAGMLLLKKSLKSIDRSILQQTIEALTLFELDNIYIEKMVFNRLINCNLELNNYKNLQTFTWKDLNQLYKNHDVILSF